MSIVGVTRILKDLLVNLSQGVLRAVGAWRLRHENLGRRSCLALAQAGLGRAFGPLRKRVEIPLAKK
jgi:hypothetical protein